MTRRRAGVAERREQRAEVDDPEVVLAAALRFLETRSRSVAEVRRRLTGAGYREPLVDAAIARLVELGMLDDAAFAAQWVESRDRAHPRGEHALMLELRQKGIEASVIAATLRARREAATRWAAPVPGETGPANDTDTTGAGDAPGSVDETAARHLLERRARMLERIDDPRVRRQRAYALLARNGFAPDVCASVARAWTEEHTGD